VGPDGIQEQHQARNKVKQILAAATVGDHLAMKRNAKREELKMSRRIGPYEK